jgi:hypothetical protein
VGSVPVRYQHLENLEYSAPVVIANVLWIISDQSAGPALCPIYVIGHSVMQ